MLERLSTLSAQRSTLARLLLYSASAVAEAEFEALRVAHVAQAA